jgi:hypothetical protein
MIRNLVGSIYGRSSIRLLIPSRSVNKHGFIWQSGFRGEDFLEIGHSETRIAYGGHVCYRIETINRNLVGNIHGRSSIKIAHLVPIR